MSPRRNWDSPIPLAAGECSLPPGPKGWGAHSPAAKGVGESQLRRLEKKLSTLPTLWSEVSFFNSSDVGFSKWSLAHSAVTKNFKWRRKTLLVAGDPLWRIPDLAITREDKINSPSLYGSRRGNSESSTDDIKFSSLLSSNRVLILGGISARRQGTSRLTLSSR